MKQGSSDEAWIENDWLDLCTIKYLCAETLLDLYNEMLKEGICAEQARMVLPQNMMTEWIWSGTLFAFAKMCNLRLDAHTQKETQEIAQKIDKLASELYPVSWKALVHASESN